MRRALLVVVVVAVGAAALVGYVGGSTASPAAADAAPAKPAKADLRVKNTCYVFSPVPNHDSFGANRVIVEMLLDGVLGGAPAQVILSGSCTYWWGNEPNFGDWARARSWDCDLKTFAAEWPPLLAEQDIRGNPRLESWYGQKSQPSVGDRKSLHPLRIDDFKLKGPGQLAINCAARLEESDTSPLTSKCKMSWYNKFVPAETHFEGTCGVEAVVRNN